MTLYCFDTDTISAMMSGKDFKTKKMDGDVCTTIFNKMEIEFGLANVKQSKAKVSSYSSFLNEAKILLFDNEKYEVFLNIKTELFKSGKPIGDFDVLIATVCICHDAVLVTRNTKHFENIKGLKVENWLE